MDPGQDQEAGVVDDLAQASFTLVMGPSDALITGGDLPGGAGEANAGEWSEIAVDAVAELMPDGTLVAEVVVGGDGGVPGPRGDAIAGGDGMDGKSGQPVDALADGRAGILDGMLPPSVWSWAIGRPPGLWQGEDAGLVHAQHDDAHAHGAQASIGTAPIERRAGTAGEFGTGGGGMIGDQTAQTVEILGREDPSAPDAGAAFSPHRWFACRRVLPPPSSRAGRP